MCPGDYFYTSTLQLTEQGIFFGCQTAPPCINYHHIPCFRPSSNLTRGQVAKIVTLATGINDPVKGQTFEDVPVASTFYTYTERLASRGCIAGYPCGGAIEPCVPPGSRPYFRPNSNMTRGQLSKIAAQSFGFNEPPGGPTFQDVPVGSAFHPYIERIVSRGIVNGYPCGGSREPCIPPDNRLYFRPNNNVTRGQTTKIVYNAMEQFPTTPTPTVTATPVVTLSPTPYETPTYGPSPTPRYTAIPTSTPFPPFSVIPSATPADKIGPVIRR